VAEWYDIAQGVGAIASAVISLGGFYFVYRQIKQTNDNLRQSNHTAIYSINTDLYKFLADNSHLRPYFYDNKKVEEEHRSQVFSVCELLADFFEFILVEENSLSEEIRKPWANYRRMIYRNSPAFRRFLHENSEQYCDKMLRDFWHIACQTQLDELQCKTITSEADFLALDGIYQGCFKDSSVPTETLKSWWQKQNSGLIAAYLNGEIIGGLSYWGLTPAAYNKLCKGECKERDLSPADLSQGHSHYIYISEIALSASHVRQGYALNLLRALSADIDKRFTIHKQKLSLLALGYSPEGRALLDKLQFKQILSAHESPDKQALYRLEIVNQDDLKAFIKGLL
jgi:hypothetical protein